jgi:predicted short-subunit dehydrogenase-like oxidoreductase (DUF2520 family)
LNGIDLSRLRLTILGCGSVGRVFAHHLAGEVAELILWSRSSASAAQLEADLGGTRGAVRRTSSLGDAVAVTDCALLCVTDEAIAATAARVASARRHGGAADEAPVALHPNGWFGPEHLEVLAGAGWATGKMHPLCAMPPISLGPPISPGPPTPSGDGPVGALRGAWFACGGAPRAREVASTLVDHFGGHQLGLRDGEGASHAYHAAATLLAGGVVALVESARRVFETSLCDREDALPALVSLLGSAVRDLGPLEPSAVLAGPVARGSEELVRGHLEVLRECDEDAARTYVLLARRMLELAEERGSIDASKRAELERLLGE